MKAWMALVVLAAFPAAAAAEVKTQRLEYRDGEAVLEGYLAYDDQATTPRPGVLVVHEWKGLGPYAERRAGQLAALGYVALAADIYGKGVRPADHAEAGKLAGHYKSDRGLMRGRIRAALETLRQQPQVDQSRIAAIGYCFGGTTVLELARSGADVLGVASFHGALDTPMPAAPGQVKARVLVFHGAEDQFVTPEQVEAFEREMQAAGVDYRVVAYPGAVHSFTVPEAGNDPSTGVAYNAEADKKSWEAMLEFFRQIFHSPASLHASNAP